MCELIPMEFPDRVCHLLLMFCYQLLKHVCLFNPFPSLMLQSARDLKVPSPSKRSKAFLV